jgi:xanthine dehydrogenase accessory factor
MRTFYETLADVAARQEPCALAIVSHIVGSSPQKPGAKALFFRDGRLYGTVGGGALEAAVKLRALAALTEKRPEIFEMSLDVEEGLLCGGRARVVILPQVTAPAGLWWRVARREGTVTWGVRPDFQIAETTEAPVTEWQYVETVQARSLLWIAGSGHVAKAIAPLALMVDFAVSVLDDRPEYASHEHFPPAVDLQVEKWEELALLAPPARPTFGLIVTRGHRHDTLVLRHWLKQPFVFIGMIGSRRKRQGVFEQLIAMGADTAALGRVACPVGLPIHAVSVQEIAISILAQYIQQRAEKLPPGLPTP